MQKGLIRLIGVVFSNGAMFSVSDKSDSVNERTQEISKFITLVTLHIQGVWQNAHEIY